ncbi:MAG: DUF5666 domain-containing protein [Chloroflexi bacterium]|nr:DUF5666 domain-containing protein [Chloroflexota bacterium]
MTKNLKLVLMGLAIVAATLLALPMATDQAYAAAPSEKRDFFGTVVDVALDVIHVSLTDGMIVDVTVTEETVIRLPLKEDAQLTDLFEGDTVAVSLTDDLTYASKIFVIPGKTQFRHVPGEIIAVAEHSITLQPLATGSEPIVFDIGPDTKVIFRAGATEMVEGVFAVVLTRRNPLTGELSPNSLEIHVAAGRSQAPPTETHPEDTEARPEPSNEARVTGVFEGLDDAGNWIVGEKTVTTDSETEIDSGIVAGRRVKVDGVLLDDGTFLAREIETLGQSNLGGTRTRIEGIFEGLNDEGHWIVGGTIVIISDETDTDGEPFMGQRVIVVGTAHDQQTIVAREVENIVAHEADDASEEHRRSFKLEGVFEGVNDHGDWIVNGVEISLDHLTRLEGTPQVGSTVKIKGVQLDGKMLALKIEVENDSENFRGQRPDSVTLRGFVDAMSEDGSVISVNSHRVHISDLTETDGDIVVGVGVKILAVILEDGTLVAKEIDVQELDTAEGYEGNNAEHDENDDEDDEDANRIDGLIEQVNDNGTILVNSITIVIPSLLAEGREFAEGMEIRVYGVFQDDGSLLATRIRGGEVDEEDDVEVERIRGVIDEVITEGDVVIGIIVNGHTIHIRALTEIDTPLRPGVQVVVAVITTDGGLAARKIDQDRRGRQDGTLSDEAEERPGRGRLVEADEEDELRELDGIVASFSDRRVLLRGGRTVAINADTRIDGELFIGAEVEIRLILNDNGILVAKTIKVSQADGDETDADVEDDIDEADEEAVGVEEDVEEDSASPDEEDTDEQESVAPREEEVKLDGIVRGFNSTRLFLRNGLSLTINRDTEIDGDLLEGAEVDVKALRRSDGTLVAVEIEVQKPQVDNSGSDDEDIDDEE